MRAAALLSILALAACRDPRAGPPGHVPLTPGQKARLAELTAPAAPPVFPIGASLGGGRIVLEGARIDPVPARPGTPVEVTWLWRCVRPLDSDYRVFVHVEDAGGKRLGGADHLFAEGLAATSSCVPGTTYADPHRFAVAPGFDRVRLRVGMYRLDGRLPVDPPGAPDDRIAGPTIPVASPPPPPSILIAHAASPPIIDGDLGDPAWSAATTIDLVRSLDGGAPSLPTRLRMLWSGDSLYAAFEVTDPDLRATLTGRDAHVYEEEAVELFAGPESGGYREIDLSPADALFDASFTGPRQGMDVGWESGARHAVRLDGTLAPGDRDRGYTAELAIPLERLGVRAAAGGKLLLNAYRLERGADGATEGSALSPPLRGDFHAPDRFARAVLAP